MSEPISMRKVREILRLKYECGRSQRRIAASLQIAVGTVSGYLKRAEEAGLRWSDAQALRDVEVERRLFRDLTERNMPAARAPIDVAHVHSELRRKSQERDAAAPVGGVPGGRCGAATARSRISTVSSANCTALGEFAGRSMRRVHRAGERAFIDYSGDKPKVIDVETDEVRAIELFVMVLGASNYTYAEAAYTQTIPDFVGATIRGFEFFGATPEVIVPDQVRSAVSGPDRYEPDINSTYMEMAQTIRLPPSQRGLPNLRTKRRWRTRCWSRSAGFLRVWVP